MFRVAPLWVLPWYAFVGASVGTFRETAIWDPFFCYFVAKSIAE